jgi:hypothetical protein
MCVLEWCKLFADKKGRFYWEKIVTSPQDFKAALFLKLGLQEEEFQDYISKMLDLRDKVIAHSDLVRTGYVPQLDIAKEAIWFYHWYFVNREAEREDLSQLPTDIEKGYQECEDEAKAVYYRAQMSDS